MSENIHLGELEQILLLAVLRRRSDGYAVPLLEDLEAAGRRLSRGALYTALERLEQKDLVRSRLGEPLAERGGRARRYYEVTAGGLAALRESRRVLLALWDGLEAQLERS